MDLPNNYFFLLIISDLIFFALGAIIGSLLTYNLTKRKKESKNRLNVDKIIRNIIILLVTVAWVSSVLVETVDRTYSPNILVHLIFGMFAGGTLDINFGEILSNFGRMKLSNKKIENGDKTQDN